MLKDTKANKVFLIVLVVILGLVFTVVRGCDLSSGGRRADQSVEFTSTDSLKVSTIANDIIIECDPKATRASISVGNSDKDLLRVVKSSSQVSVDIKPKTSWFFRFFSYRPSNLVITLPTSSLHNLEVSSISGNIRLLQAIDANMVKISSTSGEIDLLDVMTNSNLRLITISGKISSRVLDCAGDLELKSTSGNLEVQKIQAATSKLTSISGSIEAEVSLLEGGSLEAGSTSGSVNLDLRNSKDLALTASSTSGSIMFNDQEMPKRATTSTGSEKHPVRLSSVSGSINVTY